LTFVSYYVNLSPEMNNNSNKELITEDVVRHVARLSRLSLDEEDVAKYQHQLSHILEYIAQLNEVDVEGVPPTSHVLSSLKNVFRKDELKR